MEEKRFKINQSLLEWYDSIIFALVFLLVLFTFVFRIVVVSGDSMETTLQGGDRLLLQSVGYSPRRGDVVVIDDYIDYGAPLVKRIIAVGGDTVDIDFAQGIVQVNGVEIQEPYISSPTQLYEGMDFPVTVPEGAVFLLGDNRMDSRDSRDPSVGFIDQRSILGKVIFRIFPLQKIGAIR